MLILSRKCGQSIVIDGRIRVQVVELGRGRVHLGISAPREMPVFRQEIFDKIQQRRAAQQQSQAAATALVSAAAPEGEHLAWLYAAR